jgi:hypothetical protein
MSINTTESENNIATEAAQAKGKRAPAKKAKPAKKAGRAKKPTRKHAKYLTPDGD